MQKNYKNNKFKVRNYTRCSICDRSRAVFKKEQICRICFRNLVTKGHIPGYRKISE